MITFKYQSKPSKHEMIKKIIFDHLKSSNNYYDETRKWQEYNMLFLYRRRDVQ